jgi:hypothetical protein
MQYFSYIMVVRFIGGGGTTVLYIHKSYEEISCILPLKESRVKTSLGLWSFLISVSAVGIAWEALSKQIVLLIDWGILDTTLCDQVCHWLATGRWFSPSTPISFTNKTDRHDITEILLKVALNTINQT